MSRYYEYIGRVLKEAREKKNYTQQYVADKTGISRATYSHFEMGIIVISINTWFKLTEILDIDAYQAMREAQRYEAKG